MLYLAPGFKIPSNYESQLFGERSGGDVAQEISKLDGVEGVFFDLFKGACTTRQCGDGRVQFPLGPSKKQGKR